MEQRYHIYFSGEVLEGHSVANVRAKLGKLFNADAITLDKLFSGKRQAVKRNCDKATALKYKQAMESAGAKPVITAAQESAPTTAAPATQTASSGEEKQPSRELTKAERIAAIAAGDDGSSAGAGISETVQIAASNTNSPAFDVAETGADLLRPEERQEVEPANVDTSSIKLTATGTRLSDESLPPPSAPDTSHLSMGSVGEAIPNLPGSHDAEPPDISGIDLAPSGTDFSDCAPDDPEPLDLDLSGIDLAPDGADLLEEQYRKKSDAVAPPTDHLSLE